MMLTSQYAELLVATCLLGKISFCWMGWITFKQPLFVYSQSLFVLVLFQDFSGAKPIVMLIFVFLWTKI